MPRFSAFAPPVHVPFTRASPSRASLPRRPRPLSSPTARASASLSASDRVPFADLFRSPDSDSVLTRSSAPLSLVSHVAAKNSAGATVLLGWLRHYGCTLCKKQTADWNALLPRLHECGDVAVVLVGNGSPEQAADFAAEMGWQGEIYTDPERKTYAALEFSKGAGRTFTLAALGKVVKSVVEGNAQTWSRMPTDAFQQGGAVVVDPKGMVTLLHRDAYAGDHMQLDELRECVCEACAELQKV